MRGWPGLESALVLLAIALLAVPLSALTGGRRGGTSEGSDGAGVDPAELANVIRCFLELRFSETPETFSVGLSGEDEPLVKSTAGASHRTFSARIEVPSVDAAAEFWMQATWSGKAADDRDRAVQVSLEPEGVAAVSTTLWSGEGQAVLDEYFLLRWAPLATDGASPTEAKE